jgi:transposase
MTESSSTVEVGDSIVGVDTHKDVHVAVAIDSLGRRLAELLVPMTPAGLTRLRRWAEDLSSARVWGIEGTGSYGAGLTRHLRGAGKSVHEVSRPNRRVRRERGKSDSLDAELAARSVLAQQGLGAPKSGAGSAEALPQLRATRRAAVKARTQAANLLAALLVTAAEDLRADLDQGTLRQRVARCSRLRPGTAVDQPREACKLSLRSAARRWQHLSEEITELDAAIASITAAAAPDFLDQVGVGPDVAAALLIAAGGNTNRLRHEASFASLCGVNPLPASSGKTRRRLNRGGDRQANAALHTVALTRMRFDPRTQDYVVRRTAQGLSKREIMRCLKRYIARDLYPHILASQAG